MAVSRMTDQVGRVLSGRYRLVAPLGAGASAQVFLADDTRLRRRVAVKVLHAALADDESFLRRFRAEAQAAAALSHPNIVAVYDWGEDDGTPYIVTEYLGGGSLRALLDRGNRLTTAQALLVGLEAARALDYAHTRGFVHRDVKPANLLFGEDGRLRVADFGLARALAEAAWTEPMGAVMGTARYASPEQARGEGVDGKADVYALALVLVEAVTGKVPFAADTTIGTLMARVDKPVDVPESLGPLRRALERAGQPDPADRPDAGQLGVRLMAVAEDLDRPEPLPLAGATGSLPAIDDDRDRTLLPGQLPAEDRPPVWVPAPDADGPPPYEIDTSTTHRRRRWPIALAVLVLAALVGGGAAYAWVNVRTPSHDVPTFVDLTIGAAEALADENGWDVEIVDVRRDGTQAGQVLEQVPEPGSSLREGETVRLTVSEGQSLRTVPTELRGLPFEEAVAALQAAQLASAGEHERAFDEEIPAHHVIGLAEGTPARLETGSPVTLVVSDGPTPREVPAIPADASFEQACAALAEVQLGCNRVEVFSDTVPAGRVVGTNPGPGDTAPRDSAVDVQFSKGPELIPIPDVRGQSVSAATTALEEAGFDVRGSLGNPNRPVSNTDPAPGTPRPRGSGVTLFTSLI